MSILGYWLTAIALGVAIGASYHLDEPETETAEEIAAEQARIHRAEQRSWLVDQSVAWSPYK
jgi:hypothetical protein